MRMPVVEGDRVGLREQVAVHVAPPALRDRAVCLLVRRIDDSSGEVLPSVVHANPYACLNFTAAGRVGSGDAAFPRSFLCGPFSGPLGTVASGGLVSCSLVFPAWLLAPVFGCGACELVDGLRDAQAVPRALPQHIDFLLEDLCAGRCDVDPVWSAWDAVTRGHAAPDLALATLLEHGVAAASAQLACSDRHYRRLFREAVGLAPAVWARLARWERALGGLAGGEQPALTEVALGAGYADQAHLTRETRAIAGAPPARLRQAVMGAQGHWSLSPARVRSVQDAIAR